MSGAKFPLRTAYHRQPLPRVIGPTVSEYYGLIRLPPVYRGSSTYGLSSLSLQTPLRFTPSSVSGFPLRASLSSYLMTSRRRTGLPKFLYASLHACHGLTTPADLRILAIADASVLPSGSLKPSASAIAISKLCQRLRERDLPCGLHDSLCTLHLFCSHQTSMLRHRRNTRYGWVANPYPTGTFTLQDAPSFAWRASR